MVGPGTRLIDPKSQQGETMLRKTLNLFLVLLTAFVVVQAQETAPKPMAPPVAPKTNLKVGQAAPDFTLPDTTGKQFKLSDFRGKKNVVLAFYVLAFTGG
jgi:cytochrome oxidase Cu insertion factor (SCO1/SenC/PrrC family)